MSFIISTSLWGLLLFLSIIDASEGNQRSSPNPLFYGFDLQYQSYRASSRHLLASSSDKGGERTTWDGKKLSDRFCGMDEDNQCHVLEYGQALSKVAAPGIVLAIFSIISFIVFCAGRFCCNCFGGRYRSKGVCCGKRDSFEGYSLKEVWIVKILLLAVMVAIALSSIVGYVGNKKTDEGVNTMISTLLDTGHTFVDKATQIGNTLTNLTYTQDAGQQVLDAIRQAEDLLDQAESVKIEVNKYNGYRSAALITSFALPLFLLVVGAVAAIFNFKYLALFAFIFCFLVSMIIWLSFGIHQLTATVFSDICVEIDIQLAPKEENTNSSSPLDVILKCANGGAFDEVTSLATDALDESYQYACGALTQLCNDTRVNCSDNYVGGNCSRQNLEDFLDETITDYVLGCNDTLNQVCPWNQSISCMSPYLCFSKQRTVEECSTMCNNTDIRSLANTTVVNLKLLFTYTDLINNQILPLLNCTFIKETLDKLDNALCVTLRGGIKNIAAASCILGVFLVPGTILLLLGFKRFRKNRHPRDSGMEQDDLEVAEIHGTRVEQSNHVSHDQSNHVSHDQSNHVLHDQSRDQSFVSQDQSRDQSFMSDQQPPQYINEPGNRGSYVPPTPDQRMSVSQDGDQPLYPTFYPGQVEGSYENNNRDSKISSESG